METDKCSSIAQQEYENHTDEALRLRDVIDNLLVTMEYHTRQASHWQEYLLELGGSAVANVVQMPSQRSHLTLVQGEA